MKIDKIVPKKDRLVSSSSKLNTKVYYDNSLDLYFNPIENKKYLDDFYKNEYWDKFGREDKKKYSLKSILF